MSDRGETLKKRRKKREKRGRGKNGRKERRNITQDKHEMQLACF
jgi:hypothetical protein